jgi:pilus assembly protein CpaB
MEGTMGRRTLLLVAALVIAALGTTGVFLYVDGVDERAQADYELVEVLVATNLIQAGTSAQTAQDTGSLDLRPFLVNSLEGLPALSDISGIADKVALAPIAAGEPILESQFGEANQTGTLPIPEGKMAVSVQLDDPARVAGFVGPKSRVAIFLTTAGAGGAETTRLLLSDIEVLAAGQTTNTTSGGDEESGETEDLPRALLTLAVDQVEAQKIVYGTQNGRMYFGLLREDSTVDSTDPGISADNLFD